MRVGDQFSIGLGSGRLGILIGLAVLPGLMGCETLGQFIPEPASSSVEEDILRIKLLLEEVREDQKSNHRKIDFQILSLDEKVDNRRAMLDADLKRIEKTLRDQNEEISRMRTEFTELSFQIDALTKKLGMRTADPTPPSEPVAPPPEEPKPTAGEAVAEATRQYDLGRYDLARKGFTEALALGLSDEEARISARFHLAEACFRENDFPAAREEFRNVIELNQRHDLAWRSLERLADVEEKEGRISQAIELYEAIEGGYPDYQYMDRVRGQIVKLKASLPPS